MSLPSSLKQRLHPIKSTATIPSKTKDNVPIIIESSSRLRAKLTKGAAEFFGYSNRLHFSELAASDVALMRTLLIENDTHLHRLAVYGFPVWSQYTAFLLPAKLRQYLQYFSLYIVPILVLLQGIYGVFQGWPWLYAFFSVFITPIVRMLQIFTPLAQFFSPMPLLLVLAPFRTSIEAISTLLKNNILSPIISLFTTLWNLFVPLFSPIRALYQVMTSAFVDTFLRIWALIQVILFPFLLVLSGIWQLLRMVFLALGGIISIMRNMLQFFFLFESAPTVVPLTSVDSSISLATTWRTTKDGIVRVCQVIGSMWNVLKGYLTGIRPHFPKIRGYLTEQIENYVNSHRWLRWTLIVLKYVISFVVIAILGLSIHVFVVRPIHSLATNFGFFPFVHNGVII